MRDDHDHNEKLEESNMLDQGDPLNFWLKEANYHVDRLDFQVASPADVLSIIVHTFGREWILETISNTKKQHVLDNRHPLIGALMIVGKKQVCELYELANYIKALYQVPRFQDVIMMMKESRQYSTSFNQLAFAYRFKQIGVTDLEFEPPTDGGKNSDIMFKFSETTYIVESFVPENAKAPSYENVLKHTTKKMEIALKETKKRISAFITIKDVETWHDSQRKNLERDLIKLINDVTTGSLKNATDHYIVEVFNTSNMVDEEESTMSEKLFQRSTAGMKFGLMPKEKALNVMRGEKVEPKLVGRFFLEAVDLKKETSQEMLAKLAVKVERKIKQTKKESVDAKAILLVGQPYLGSEEEKLKMNYERIKGKVVDGHDCVQALLMVKHTADAENNPFYTGVFIDNRDNKESEKLLSLLINLEWRKDFLLK